MNRVAQLLPHLPEMLRRDAAGEPPLFPPADPLQYARFVIPGVPGQPWHDPAQFAWTAAFAAAHAEILGEKADAGDWHVLYLEYRGQRWDEHCREFPRLMALVDAIPRRAGTVFISRLTPGTHIPRHCGSTNTQLTCHFGIVVPDRVELRVARETRAQPEGRCIVFDDSFEHEVWNHSAAVRYNVFMQFWHPDLSDEEIAAIQRLEELPHIQHVIEQYREGASALAPVRN